MNYPSELRYTKEHEWIRLDEKYAFIGVTTYAIEQLGDVVYLELPQVGTKFRAHDAFGTIESTKTVSDLYIPLACEVLEVNSRLVDAPENLTKDAYQEGWLLKVAVLEALPQDLLSSVEYAKYLNSETEF
jgi:glycine cleavage system H protein